MGSFSDGLLAITDGPSASVAVAAAAFARQGIDEAISEATEVDQDETVMGCMARCQAAFERAVAVEPPGGLQRAQVRVSLEAVARQLASGKTEVLSQLHDMLLCLGVTDYEAEHAGLFTSLLQLVTSQGVETLLEHLDGPSLRLIIDLLQVSIACMPLPIYRLPATMRGAGDGLACLFQPLAVRFWRGGSRDNEHISGLFEAIVSVAELEQHLLRKVAVRHPKFLAYCRDIVGCWIEDCEEDREGNRTKRVVYVVAFDETTCEHTVLYETNVSPPLVRSKFARSEHRVISGRQPERKAVTEAKQAAEAAREASNSGWKALFGASTAQTLLGVRVAAHCVHTDDPSRRWRPATVVANQTTGRSAVSLVYDDDASGAIFNVEIVDDESNRSVLRLNTDPVADSSDGCQWQWLGDDGWVDFSDDASRQLELSRQNGSHGCALMLGDEQRVVEFKTMVQRDESQRERPIRRAASSINLWSAIERPRAGSDEARRRALSESDLMLEDSIEDEDEDEDGVDVGTRSSKPTIPVLAVTLKGLRGYVESGSPHASNGRMRSLDDSEGTLSPEARSEASGESSPINSEMTLFQCIMNTAGGHAFGWEQTWSVDYEVTVDGEEDIQTVVEPQLPEAVPESKTFADAYVVSCSTLQQINGRYERSDSQEVHEHPVYVGSSEVSGKYLYWQPNHEGEWVIADDIGKGYRAVNRTQSVCAYEDGCSSKHWHVWNGPRREWTDEVSVTVEKVGSPLVVEPTETNLRVEAEDAVDTDCETESKIVVVMENQRCPRGGTFTSDALLPSERAKWTDCDGNSLPDPHSAPNSPEGWAWAPSSDDLGGWSTTGWVYSVSFATHESHWTSDPITTLGSKSVVRRCRWERHIVRLPPPPTTPRTPAKALSSGAKQTLGPPADLVRKMLSEGSVNFQRKWGLDRPGTAEVIAGQMGERVLQAFRDFEGSSFASAEANQEEWRRSFGADDNPRPPGYCDALTRPVAAVPPPPSYSAIMSGSALPADDAASFDDDLFAAVMGSPMPKAQPRPELELEPEPKPKLIPDSPFQLVLEPAPEKDEPFASPLTAPHQPRSPCLSLIYGRAGSYRPFDSRDIDTSTGSDGRADDSPTVGRPELRLLALLHSAQRGITSRNAPSGSSAAALLETEWVNMTLVFKLRQQLADPLAVVSSAFPPWIEELMSSCSFLFPIALREEFFRVSAFGAARAVEWLRVQRKQQRNAEANAPLGDRLGPLRVERWLIRRDDFLNQARQLLAHHATRRSLLLVEFEGESGIGTGVHVSFFTDAAARLSETAENDEVGMWMPDSSAPRGEALACALHPASLLEATSGAKVGIILKRFETLGWLFGKALIDKRHDERLLPLMLSPVFLDLALGRDMHSSVSPQEASHGQWAALATLASADVQGGSMVSLLLTQIAGVRDGSIAEKAAAEMIEMCDITFTDPANESPLCAGGEERVLAWEEVEEFLGLLSAAWLGEGVRLQCDYFARALGQVVPLQKLQLFTTAELLELVCGAAVQWSREDLEACVVPGDGYTRQSPPYLWLLETLDAMGDDASGAAQRAAFLQFVTARPRLPTGGLHALPCPIRVQQPAALADSSGGSGSKVDARLPTAHTCSLTLDLPAYTGKAALRGRLVEALALMAEYEGLVD